MLRWKLFVPLAVGLTLLGLSISKYWTVSASERQLSALNQDGKAELVIEEDALVIVLAADAELAELLAGLAPDQVQQVAAGRELHLQRTERQQADPALAAQMQLILAQAIATGEYYTASRQLTDLARDWQGTATFLLWGNRVVAEIDAKEWGCIAQAEMRLNP